MAQKDGDHANDLDFSMRTSGETPYDKMAHHDRDHSPDFYFSDDFQ